MLADIFGPFHFPVMLFILISSFDVAISAVNMTLLIDVLSSQMSAESLLSEAKCPLNYEARAHFPLSSTYIGYKYYFPFSGAHLKQNNERNCDV
jgi:hypothetical protein